LKANARSDEGGGLAKNLLTPASVQKLQTALHTKAKGSPNFRTYQPQAVRRVMIDKLGGTGKRPLGIPVIKDD
jgi:hypothetical protein